MTTDAQENTCCRCCTSFIFTLGLTALFFWLNLRCSPPVCSIEQLYVFALNKTLNSPKNHTITYDLKLNNKNNKDKGIYYDTLNLTFYYKPNLTVLIPTGNTTFVSFYQGHQKSTHRYGNFSARGVNWIYASKLVDNSTAAFRVELATAVRYKIVFWKTKRHRLMIGADLMVDSNGGLVKRKKKGTKLSLGSGLKSFGIRGILGISCFVFLVLL